MTSRKAVDLLRRSWNISAARLEQRCEGLTDDELLWEPAADAWNLVPNPDRSGSWTYPYELTRRLHIR